MLLEVRTVGRKVPRDGRLEVSEVTYRRLASLGPVLRGCVDGEVAPATMERMPCGACQGAPTGGHEHLFIRSEVFQRLAPGATCVIELAADGVTVEVARPHPLTSGSDLSG